MIIIKDAKIAVDKNEVLRYLGYRKERMKEPKQIILNTIREEIILAAKLIEPKGIYHLFKIKDFSISEKKITLENDFSCNITDSMMKSLLGIERLAIGIVTIAHALENKISEYFQRKEYSRGLVLDAVGTVAVRYLSQYVISIICQEAQKLKFTTTKRFVPGTQEWDIKVQKTIFQILPANQIDVKLSDSLMMNPAKSLSWAIGMGKQIVNPTKDDNSCRICYAKNCQFRKNI